MNFDTNYELRPILDEFVLPFGDLGEKCNEMICTTTFFSWWMGWPTTFFAGSGWKNCP